MDLEFFVKWSVVVVLIAVFAFNSGSGTLLHTIAERLFGK